MKWHVIRAQTLPRSLRLRSAFSRHSQALKPPDCFPDSTLSTEEKASGALTKITQDDATHAPVLSTAKDKPGQAADAWHCAIPQAQRRAV